MRDYLYLWADVEKRFLHASGIEFRDLVSFVPSPGGVLLLRHGHADALFDPRSQFDFVPTDAIPALAEDDIYGYGDFVWTTYRGDFPSLSDDEIADLSFFAHMTRPRAVVEQPSLGNDFLCYAHDDGWVLKLFWKNPDVLAGLLRTLLAARKTGKPVEELVQAIAGGRRALWISEGVVEEEERILSIDAVLNRRFGSA